MRRRARVELPENFDQVMLAKKELDLLARFGVHHEQEIVRPGAHAKAT